MSRIHHCRLFRRIAAVLGGFAVSVLVGLTGVTAAPAVTRGRRMVALAACLLSAPIALVGCKSGGVGGPPPTTANVTVQYVIDAGGAPLCTSNSVYQYTPVALTGTDGSTSQITHAVAQEVFATGTGNGVCMFTDGASVLRPGRWRIGELHAAVCDVALRPGYNLVTIQSGVCSTAP